MDSPENFRLVAFVDLALFDFAIEVLGDRILVGLTVRGSETAQARGGAALRWQVLTVRQGRVVDIVAFDDRRDAFARAGVPAP